MPRVPKSVASSLKEVTGMTPEQADTALQLISLAENGEPMWWKHYNYIEKLGDGRGYTVTIFGACSGTGDLAMIFDEIARLDPNHKLLKYHAALKKCKGEHVDGIQGLLKDIPALGDDETWRRAVWKVYIDMYWKFASQFCAKTGSAKSRPGPVLGSVLAKGFMVDTAINHGANMESFSPVIKRMQNPNASDPGEWLGDFMKTRRELLKSGFQHLDTSKTGDRCKLWRALLKEGNLDLKTPIRAREGYWGKNVIVQSTDDGN